LALGIGPDGLPRGNTVSRPLSSEFDEPASDAVKKWKFSPAIRDGKAVATNVNAEESFRLY
jgi:outer membrane biosynthesis protein TonB